MKDKLTVEEINAKLQEAADKDMGGVAEDPVLIEFTGLEPDIEGWDEYVAHILAEGLPEKEEV